MTTGEWQRACKEEFGIDERTFYRMKKKVSNRIFKSATDHGVWLAK
jgi:hypothetical protein